MGIFDLFSGKKRSNPPPRVEAGVSSAIVYDGNLQSFESDASLSGTAKYVTFSNLVVNTTIVATSIQYFLDLVSKAGITTDDPADDSPRALELRDKTLELLTGMETPWSQVVRRSAGYVFHGFQVQEWTTRLEDDGTIGFKSVNPRAQSTVTGWDLTENGEVKGIVQTSPQDYREIYIPRGKLVYIAEKSISDQPEGIGLFRFVIKAAKRLERYQQLEGYGYETDLRGVPVGKAPLMELERLVEDGSMSRAQADAIVKPLATFLQNHVKGPNQGLLIDSGVYTGSDEALTPSANKMWSMELLKSTGAGHEAINNAINRELHEIARVFGTEALLLGSGPLGSMALSQDKANSLALRVDGVMTRLKESFERDLIKPLFEMNGWPLDLMPKLKSEPIRYQDIRNITGAVQELANSGVVLTADDAPVKELYNIMGLSAPELHEQDLGLMGGGNDPFDTSGAGRPTTGDPTTAIGKPQPEPKKGR